MKRLLLTLSFFTPALIGMESPLEKALVQSETTTTTELVTTTPEKEKTAPFDIKKYINIKKLLLSAADTLFDDDKEFSDEKKSLEQGSGKGEAAETSDTTRQLINALIKALRLEQRILTIGSSTQADSKNNTNTNNTTSTAMVTTGGKQVPLKDICNLEDLRKLLIDINDNYWKQHTQINTTGKEANISKRRAPIVKPLTYAQRFYACIDWDKLENLLGAESNEFILLDGAAQAIVAYSEKNSNEIDITEYLHIQTIIKLLFGFDIAEYAEMPALNKLVNTLCKKDTTSLEMYLRCIKPVPLLLFLGCPEEDVDDISKTLTGLLKFAYDLAQDEDAALDKMLTIINVYGEYDVSARLEGLNEPTALTAGDFSKQTDTLFKGKLNNQK